MDSEKIKHDLGRGFGVTAEELERMERMAKAFGVQMSARLKAVDHPDHYNRHPSGIECIDVAEHMGFNLGNALKYIWRCDLKRDAIEDLKKAAWYVNREIALREKAEESKTEKGE